MATETKIDVEAAIGEQLALIKTMEDEVDDADGRIEALEDEIKDIKRDITNAQFMMKSLIHVEVTKELENVEGNHPFVNAHWVSIIMALGGCVIFGQNPTWGIDAIIPGGLILAAVLIELALSPYLD
jgi:monomeric isocitrate dehydrogenase